MERLGDLLEKEGYAVISVSSSTNRYVRLADIVNTLIRRRKDFDVLLLQVFGGHDQTAVVAEQHLEHARVL